MSHNNLYFLIESLLKEKSVSRIVKEYFKLIGESVDSEGRTRINPLSIAMSLPLLIGKNYSEFFEINWFSKYARMLGLYFGPSSRFFLKKWVKKYVLRLLLSDFLSLEQRK